MPETIKPLESYRTKLAQLEETLQAVQRRYVLISNARLAVFVLGAGGTYLLFREGFWLGMAAGVALLLGFMYLLKIHTEVADRRDYMRRKRRILQEEMDAQDWDFSVFDGAKEEINPRHAFSYDLDLFGERSIFQYLNRAGSEPGKKRLIDWLTKPEQNSQTIRARQEAVKELSGKLDWTLHLQTLMRAHRAKQKEVDDLKGWLNLPEKLEIPRLFILLVNVLPALLLASLLLWIIPDFPVIREFFGGWNLSGWVPLAFFLAQLAIAGQNLKYTQQQYGQISSKARFLHTYSQLLEAIEAQEVSSEHLLSLRKKLETDGQQASDVIESLGDMVYRFDQRLNMVAGVLLNGTLMWDVRYLIRFAKWRAAHREVVPQWLEVITELDALLSLGRYAFNRPDLNWPEVGEGDFYYEAKGLGHPLLKPETRVDNDVSLGKPGEFLIITGANMAGKSTFLRSVGTSLVLGMAGAPVCADTLRFAPVPMITSVRAADSLADHESYFYAELKQLKRIIDQLEAHGPAFVIVDEMLRGTNSRDKQVGSRRFIEQLIQRRGVGLVATHDLSLGELADAYPDFVRNMRFEVDITDEKLTFDYRLRPGISQNLNATFLMQQMGIMPKK